MNPILLQQQLKNNNKDLLDFCQDLKSWGQEMQKKEPISQPENKHQHKVKPPEKKCSKEKEDSDVRKETKKRCMSYADWEKFDADKECDKVDEDSDSELTDEFDEKTKEEALIQKDKGNQYVKTGNWDEAIKCYTQAIEYYAYDPVFYANRALCYLKKNDMIKAESDCTISLKLDNTYVKAYQRRAVARESLDKLQEAELDLLTVLKFEPRNSESMQKLDKLREKIKSVKPINKNTSDLQRPISKFTASRQGDKRPTSAYSNLKSKTSVSNEIKEKGVDLEKPQTFWPSGNEVTLVKSIKKPPHLRSKKPLKRIAIREVNSMKVDVKQPIEEEIVPKPFLWEKSTVIEHKLPENESDKSKREIKSNIPPEMHKELKNLNNFDVVVKLKEEGTSKLEDESDLEVPKTSVQFHSTWKRLKDCSVKKYKYLKLISPQDIPEIFKESLESQIFSDILVILADYFVKGGDRVYEYLLNLSKIKRFSALSMFFTLNDKNCLWKMFNQIKECEDRSKEEVDALIKKYEL